MEDRRRFERKPTSIRVEMRHPAFGLMIGSAQDISDGGAQVTVDAQVSPPVGTVVDVQFKKMVGMINEKPVPMKVMHSSRNVLGLMFVGQ